MARKPKQVWTDISWEMPEVLDEQGLALSASVLVRCDGEEERPISVTIRGTVLELEKEKRDVRHARVVVDWRPTVRFEDGALAETILVQHMLLSAGYELVHAPIPEPTTKEPGRPSFRHGLFRQLLIAGYFRTWATPEFGASEAEISRLTALNPVTALGPLGTAHEILGLQACHTEESSELEAKEEAEIRAFEDGTSALLFGDSVDQEFRECPLVESGEFGQFAVRQVRGNVWEHAKATLGLSMVRLVRPAIEHESWGLKRDAYPTAHPSGSTCDGRGTQGETDDYVYVRLTAIDDGRGIHRTLRERWNAMSLKQSDGSRRVLARLGSCQDYASVQEELRPSIQTILFATDEEGSSKHEKERSPEAPGLHRLAMLVQKEKGVLEITSGGLRVRLASGALSVEGCKRAMPVGTLVRVWIPLRSGDEVPQDRRRKPRGHIRHMVGANVGARPSDIVCLSEEWSEADLGSFLLLEDKMQRFAEIVRDRVEALLKPEGHGSEMQAPAAVFLDWSELQWREHECSCFLHAVRRWYGRQRLRVPVIPVNVPDRVRLLARDALDSFSRQTDLEEPTWEGPLPFYLCTDQDESFWIGIARLAGEDADAVASALDAALQSPGTYSRSRALRSPQDRMTKLTEACKRRSPMFSEGTTKDLSSGRDVPSKRYFPVVSHELIQQRIGETFTGRLHRLLLSDCMLQKKPIKRRRGQKWAYIRLPNGRLADKYFRCDLLLSPRQRPHTGFARTLTAHLVEIGRVLEERQKRRFDLVVSCTSPNHWFVHQIADGLTDKSHDCGHFVARSRAYFAEELTEFAERRQVKRGSRVLIFTDVISNTGTIQAMRRALADAGFCVGAIVALLDTRDDGRMKETAEAGSLGIRGMPDDHTVILAHEGVPIRRPAHGRTPEWQVDPETLDLAPVEPESQWPGRLAGVGELGVRGETVLKWLQTFPVLRHKHYKHGPRHSEYVCDVKQLLCQSEIRLHVAARLAWYASKYRIDLVVYPCHSNAYLLAELLKLGWRSDSEDLGFQVALCRTRSDERSYVLPEGKQMSVERVMILDDAVGGGATFKSLATEVCRHYGKRLRALHLVVFCNELSGYQTAFWSGLAAKGLGDTQKPLLHGKMHFASFISFPAESYQERRCPLCARRVRFREYLNNRSLTVYEHLFYDQWQDDLTVRDLSHHPRRDVPYATPTSVGDPVQYSKRALDMLAFEWDLRSQHNTHHLLQRIQKSEGSMEVAAHCLRKLREHVLDRLDAEALAKINESLILLLTQPDLDLDRRRILLVVKALMWEKKLVSAVEFAELVENGFLWLWDPYFLGGVLAYARMGSPDQLSCPPWRENDRVMQTLDNCLEVTRSFRADESGLAAALSADHPILLHPGLRSIASGLGPEKLALVREALTLLRSWFKRGGEARSDGAFACVLWDACRKSQGHTKLMPEISRLAKDLAQVRDDPNLDSSSREQIVDGARAVLRLLRSVLDAVPLAVEIGGSEDLLKELRVAEERLRSLEEALRCVAAEKELAQLKRASGVAHEYVDYFCEKWTGPSGHINGLVQLFVCPLQATLLHAVKSVNDEMRIEETADNAQTVAPLRLDMAEQNGLRVFASPELLLKALHNVLANICKYQIRGSGGVRGSATAGASVRVDICRESDEFYGSRVVLQLWCEKPSWQERPSELFPVGHGNHELRKLLADFRGVYDAYCDEEKRCVVTRLALLESEVQNANRGVRKQDGGAT